MATMRTTKERKKGIEFITIHHDTYTSWREGTYMYMYRLYSILVFSLGLHIGHYDLGGSNEPIGSSSNLPFITLCCDNIKITSSIRLLLYYVI